MQFLGATRVYSTLWIAPEPLEHRRGEALRSQRYPVDARAAIVGRNGRARWCPDSPSSVTSASRPEEPARGSASNSLRKGAGSNSSAVPPPRRH